MATGCEPSPIYLENMSEINFDRMIIKVDLMTNCFNLPIHYVYQINKTYYAGQAISGWVASTLRCWYRRILL
jgi:hypothetical protein